MEEINVEVRKSVSSEHLSDVSRDEEKWSSNLEHFLEEIQQECEMAAKKHKTAWSILQYRSHAISSLTIGLTVLASVFSIPVLPNEYHLVPTILMLLSGGVISLQKLLQYEKACQLNLEFSGKFIELAISIKYVLSRARKDRVAADTTVQRYLYKHTTLITNAPP